MWTSIAPTLRGKEVRVVEALRKWFHPFGLQQIILTLQLQGVYRVYLYYVSINTSALIHQ